MTRRFSSTGFADAAKCWWGGRPLLAFSTDMSREGIVLAVKVCLQHPARDDRAEFRLKRGLLEHQLRAKIRMPCRPGYRGLPGTKVVRR